VPETNGDVRRDVRGDNAGPLGGIKVVEIGVAMAGPFCAMMLADYGAEVIKVERVGVGDDSRGWPPYFYDTLGYYFAAANRNKKSVALDLKSAEGVEVARRLIAEADVVVDNYRVGALDRAGLGWDALSALNPRLIYCSISGFGATGPRSGEPANDLFMQAYSGGMSVTGEVGGGPVKMGLSVADLTAGMLGTIAVLMALEARHRTGRGQRVETSLLEGQVAMLSYHLTRFFAVGEVPGPSGSGALGNPTYRAFRASDDWIIISAFNERMWRDLCRVLERPEWADDPRFCDARQRAANRDLLIGMINEVMAGDTIANWQTRLKAGGVPCSPINRVDTIVTEEQVHARDMIVQLELPGLGPMRMAGLPLKFSETPGRLDLHPPRLGQHTAEVMRRLGYGDAAIEDFGARGVVGLDRGWVKVAPAKAAESNDAAEGSEQARTRR
jgi:crotonobetainyl-CoA:carnitine CoA-transferase CaiB-like acyl-CoA transferase